MKLGILAGYSGAQVALDLEMIQEADRLGYHAVWSSEAYGSDAVVPLAWIGAVTKNVRLGTAIMQIPARTPSNTAMTIITLDHLSGGRAMLGLGVSGPQVAEGWHGVAFGKPLGKTREYVSIIRQILAREAPLQHEGRYYQIPYKGEDATGLGKPLKSIIHGRKDLPIYIAAIGPKNVALTGEIADGILPIFFSPERFSIFDAAVQEGFAKAGGGKGYDSFQVCPSVQVVLGDDVDACRDRVKPSLALYIGGMGAKGRNFYNDLARRYGYEEVADTLQELYLSGRRDEAIAAVPDALVDEVALCGPKERIAERLSLWKATPISAINISGATIETVRTMAELVL
ncbi:MAG: LLM class F420-dependent oxidoreductase [SAR324 cluster bacterium]|nr:LLM class F420-dependent oxidoreductase [SAR324 cluster bacterium]